MRVSRVVAATKLLLAGVATAAWLLVGNAVAAESAPATPPTAAPTAVPAEGAPSATPASAPTDAADTSGKAAKSAPATPKARPVKPARPATAKGADRLELDKTVVTGNRELPKVLYIVPWKKANLGDLPGQPFNSLLDEALTPVDRDVFRRELRYYDALEAGAGRATESGQVEK